MTRRHGLFAATVLSTALALSLPLGALAQSGAPAPSAVSQLDVTHDMAVDWSRIVSPQQREQATSSGWLALSKIAAARDDLRRRRTLAARKKLDQVQSILLNLRESQPIMTMRHRITVAQDELEYTATDQMVDDLLPLQSRIDAYAHFMPVDPVKQNLDKARESFQRNDKPAALQELRKADEGIVAIETHLPLTRTFLAVSSALDDLSRNVPASADRSLAMAEHGLHVTLSALDVPVGSTGQPASAAPAGANPGSTSGRTN